MTRAWRERAKACVLRLIVVVVGGVLPDAADVPGRGAAPPVVLPFRVLQRRASHAHRSALRVPPGSSGKGCLTDRSDGLWCSHVGADESVGGNTT